MLAIGIGLVAAAVALEVVLQVGALAVHWFVPRDGGDRGADPARRVLCVGDSFTYGLGAVADEGRYPAVLQRLLRERSAPSWHVDNRGWPGRTSRDVLLVLPGLLRDREPAFVCLLVGTNDVWGLPANVTDAELAAAAGADASPRFRVEWRTARLVALLTGRRGGVEEGGGGTTPPPPGAQVRPVASPLDAGFDALRRGDRATAERVFTAHASAPEHRARALQGLVETFAASDRPRAESLVRELAAEAAARPSPDSALAHARALLSIGDADGAFDVAATQLERSGHGAFDVLAQTTNDAPRRARIRQSIAAALTRTSGAARAPLLEVQALLQRDDAPDDATRSLALALDAGGSPALLVGHLQAFAQLYTREHLATVVADLPPSARDRALAVHARATTPARHGPTLEAHLRRAVELCRAAGAEPLLLTYPKPVDDQVERVRAVAAALGVTVVDPSAAFVRAAAERPDEPLFVPDGHCNDAGYALLAQQVADAILSVAQRRK